MVRPEHNQSLYGATNPAFFAEDAEDEKEQELFPNIPKTLPCQTDDEIVQDKPEDERESWDSKLMFLLATIGYNIHIIPIECFFLMIYSCHIHIFYAFNP